jgi:glyoxylase-like metal-dependent hydrolase (beta-lactamase superfamily II)
MDIGDIKMTWIPDGVHHVRALEQFRGGNQEIWNHHAEYIDENDWLVMSIGALLVSTAGKNVLVDLGFGPRAVTDLSQLVPGHHGDLIGGELINSLKTLGVTPGDIDGVVISHLHPDHIGWASTVENDGYRTPIFTHADYFVGANEWNFWSSAAGERGAPLPEELEIMARRLTLLDGTKTPFPGLDAMPTPGHTPGHLSFVISSGEQRALILGDAVHCPAEITETELEFAFDVDPAMNRRTKEMISKELEKPHTHMVGGHFPDAVFGRLIKGAVERKFYV